MSRAVVVSCLLVSSVAMADADPIKWHVDVSVTDSLESTTKQQTKQGPATDSDDEHKHVEGTLRMAVDDYGQPEEDHGGGVKAYRLDAPHPRGTIAGSYVLVDEERKSHDYGGVYVNTSQRTDRADGKVDGAGYSFYYAGDSNWYFTLSSSVSGSTKSHSCETEVKPHPDNKCDDTSGPMSAAGGPGISLGTTDGGTIKRNGSGFVIDYSHDDRTTDASTGRTEVHHVEVHVTLSRGETKYEAVLVPVDKKAYAAWVPEGPILGKTSDADGGNTLSVRLEIRDHKTHKPANVKFKAVYTLEASKLPGWSMNAPAKEDANDKPDLFFSGRNNPGRAIQSELAMTAESATGTDTLTVTSRDYAASGTLRATVTFDDGSESVRSAIENDRKQLLDAPFQIPLDTNGNQIADRWETENHVVGFASKIDDEDRPAGMATVGDGYSIFEEYRGFVLYDEAATDKWVRDPVAIPTPHHMRLDPVRKELLLFVDGAGAHNLVVGAWLYRNATELRVLIVPGKDQLAMLPGDVIDRPRWADFNADSADHDKFGPGQVAALLLGEGFHGATTPSAIDKGYRFQGDTGQPAFNTPRDTKGSQVPWPEGQIVTWTKLLQDKSSDALEFAIRTGGFDRATVIAYATKNRIELANALQSFQAMHELGHQTGAAEHSIVGFLEDRLDDNEINDGKYFTRGDKSCPQRYWQYDSGGMDRVRFLAGQWNPLEKSPTGKPWKYCTNETWPTMRLRQRPDQRFTPDPKPRD